LGETVNSTPMRTPEKKLLRLGSRNEICPAHWKPYLMPGN